MGEGEKKRRGRGRRRMIQAKIKLRYGTLDFWYGNLTQVWIYGILRLPLVNSLSPKARVC